MHNFGVKILKVLKNVKKCVYLCITAINFAEIRLVGHVPPSWILDTLVLSVFQILKHKKILVEQNGGEQAPTGFTPKVIVVKL